MCFELSSQSLEEMPRWEVTCRCCLAFRRFLAEFAYAGLLLTKSSRNDLDSAAWLFGRLIGASAREVCLARALRNELSLEADLHRLAYLAEGSFLWLRKRKLAYDNWAGRLDVRE